MKDKTLLLAIHYNGERLDKKSAGQTYIVKSYEKGAQNLDPESTPYFVLENEKTHKTFLIDFDMVINYKDYKKLQVGKRVQIY